MYLHIFYVILLSILLILLCFSRDYFGRQIKFKLESMWRVYSFMVQMKSRMVLNVLWLVFEVVARINLI